MSTIQILKLLKKYLKTNKIGATEDAVDVFENFKHDNSLNLSTFDENQCYKEIEYYQVNLD